MPKLPILSAKQSIKAFQKLGYEIDHQTGSHIIMRQNREPFRRLTVPNHKEIARGTLRALIRQAGLTVKEFEKLV